MPSGCTCEYTYKYVWGCCAALKSTFNQYPKFYVSFRVIQWSRNEYRDKNILRIFSKCFWKLKKGHLSFVRIDISKTFARDRSIVWFLMIWEEKLDCRSISCCQDKKETEEPLLFFFITVGTVFWRLTWRLSEETLSPESTRRSISFWDEPRVYPAEFSFKYLRIDWASFVFRFHRSLCTGWLRKCSFHQRLYNVNEKIMTLLAAGKLGEFNFCRIIFQFSCAMVRAKK